jgi:carbamoyltransferase
MKHAYWGPEFSDQNISEALRAKGMEHATGSWEPENRRALGVRREKLSALTPNPSPLMVPVDCGVRISKFTEDELVEATAQRIAEGKVVGWFQGRLEFGPRALGNRSIVVDPRRAEMKDLLNSRIKHREPFRPFAPSILVERVGDYFDETHPSPFMLMAYKVKREKRCAIPAPTHVDGTGRLQTVAKDENPRYWKLIKAFENLTGVPVLLNTSFNENEPVVCKPEEAINCFLRTKMDVLAIGNYMVEKAKASEQASES